jgi:hypothetical protein
MIIVNANGFNFQIKRHPWSALKNKTQSLASYKKLIGKEKFRLNQKI